MVKAKKTKSLGINAVLNTIKTVLGVLFPLITYPYITRVLQVDNLGKFNFSDTNVGYFSLFAAYGVATYAVRECAKVRDDKQKLTKLGSEIFTINIFTMLIAYLALALFLVFSARFQPYRGLMLILSIAIFFSTWGTDWINTVYEDFLYITIRTIAFQLLSLVLLFIFVKSTDDLYTYTWIVLISSAGANALNGFYCRKKYVKVHFHPSGELKQHLRPMTLIFLSNLTTTIFVNSDQTMLGLMCGDYNVGLYAISVKIYTVVKNIFTAVLLVVIPRISYMQTNDTESAIDKLCTGVVKVLSFIVLPMAVGLYLISDKTVLIIGGESYVDAIPSLKILSISLLCAAAASFMTYMLVVPKQKENILLISSTAAAAANVGLNFLMIPMMQQNGAAITTAISELVVFVVEFIAMKPHLDYKSILKNTLQILLACAGIVGMNYLVRWFCNSLILSTILIIVGSALIYATILFVCRNSILLEGIARAKKMLHRT